MTVRALGLVSCVLALAALSFYSARGGSAQIDTVPEIMAGRRLPNGQEIALTSDVEIREVGANEFTAEQGGVKIRVRIPSELSPAWEETRRRIKPGDHISLRGIYRTAGYLEAREYHVHTGRRLKMWISIAALVVVGLLIGKQAREGKNA